MKLHNICLNSILQTPSVGAFLIQTPVVNQGLIYIEDITWLRGDTKFLFECLTREEKFRVSKLPGNILFIV